MSLDFVTRLYEMLAVAPSAELTLISRRMQRGLDPALLGPGFLCTSFIMGTAGPRLTTMLLKVFRSVAVDPWLVHIWMGYKLFEGTLVHASASAFCLDDCGRVADALVSWVKNAETAHARLVAIELG